MQTPVEILTVVPRESYVHLAVEKFQLIIKWIVMLNVWLFIDTVYNYVTRKQDLLKRSEILIRQRGERT